MKRGSVFVYIVIVFLVCVAFFAGIFFLLQKSNRPENFTNRMSALQITSSAFSNDGKIPSRYTCDGEDMNPPLLISGAPEGTKSLVLIMDDPDAPMGTWDHWVIFNIEPRTKNIEQGEESVGVSGTNSWGKTGYGGPCPPSGTHRYFFKLYALDTMLDLPANSRKEDIEKAMEGYVLDKTELVGLYARQP